jgi:hypothetical protein
MHASSMSEAGALRVALAVALTVAAALVFGALVRRGGHRGHRPRAHRGVRV